MNLLEVNFSKRWGGAEIAVTQLTQLMQSAGHTVYVAAQRKSTLVQRVRSHGVPVLPFLYTSQLDFMCILKLAYYIRKYSIDIVNTHTTKDHYIAAFAGRLSGIPVTLTKHTQFRIKTHPLNRFLYSRLTDCIIALSDSIKQNIIDCIHINPDKIKVIYSGIKVNKFFSKEKIDTWAASIQPSKTFILAMVSRLDQVKRIDIFIEAAAIVTKKVSNVKFLIVGQDEKNLTPSLKALAASRGVSDKIEFRGFMDNIENFLYTIDIFIICSDSEGLGRGVIEAVCTGRPVIATNVGGIPEVVRDGITGILIPPRNPEILAEKILSLLKNPEILKVMSKNTVESMIYKFDIFRSVEKLISLYQEIIACKKNSRR